MAGQLGSQKVTTLNLEVVQADPDRELLLVKGWANRDVASLLGVSEQQVANYRFAAVKKLTEQIRDAGLPAEVFPELRR